MNIQKSFVVRNRLKAYISELTSTLRNTSIVSESDESRDWTETDGVSYDALFDRLIGAKNALGALNCAIDEANVAVRPLLNAVESYKAQLASVSPVTAKIRSTKLVQKERDYNEDGKVVTIEKNYKFDIDKDKYIKFEKELQKNIRDLEDQISEKNATTQVTISKELKDFLDNYDK